MHTSVYLLRHAQTQANLQHRYQSWSDTPLTAYGERQAQSLAARLKRLPFQQIVLSPSQRCQVTYSFLEQHFPKAELTIDPAWAEVHHGRWEGLTYQELQERYPEELQARFGAGVHGKAEGGESLYEANQRVQQAWRALLERCADQRVLVVSHATPIQLVLCSVFNLLPDLHWQWRIDLASISAVDVYDGGAIVRSVNEVPPLHTRGD
jgi:alpha-ribazole phosphatase